MNNKMSVIQIQQQLNLKKNQKHGYREDFDGFQMREECGGMGEDVRGLRSTNRQNSHGDVKYSVGNGAAREVIHMTHGMNNGVGIA